MGLSFQSKKAISDLTALLKSAIILVLDGGQVAVW